MKDVYTNCIHGEFESIITCLISELGGENCFDLLKYFYLKILNIGLNPILTKFR
jgi:hypothetical protein